MASMKASRGQGFAPSAIPVMSYEELTGKLPKEVVASALLRALSFHKPEHSPLAGADLCQCRDKGGQRRLWPCPEVRGIASALAREEVTAA